MGENGLVGSLHMGVGAEQGGHPAVGEKAHGPLFPRGLPVKVHHAQLGQVRGLQQLLQGLEGTGQALQIDSAHQVDHRHLDPAQVHHAKPLPRRSCRVVGRTEQGFAGVVVVVALPAAEAVVAGGDHVHPAVQQVFRRSRGDAVAVGGVLPVGDDQVNAFCLFQGGQVGAKKLTALAAHHVANA